MTTTSKDIDAVLAGLDTAGDATEACGTADVWAAGGKVAELAGLASALVSGRGGEARTALLDHVAEHLAAASGEAGIDALVALVRTVPEANRTRSFASRLGFATTSRLEAFVAALSRHAVLVETPGDEARELFACWLHELVLRDVAVDALPAARALHAQLASSGHPLAALPLRLLGCERDAPTYLPMFGEAGIDDAVRSLERGSVTMRTLPPPADHAAPTVGLAADQEAAARAAEAVKAWSKIEAKVFALAPAVAPGIVGKWLLRALPLASVEGSPRLAADRTGADAVFGALFAAAANGGARDHGLGGAYGRRAAWASFGALVGQPAGVSAEDVDAHARGCGFVLFRGAAGWFHDVAWDVGVLAVRDGGASCAVVAASDSD
jgi:hypothetical protein